MGKECWVKADLPNSDEPVVQGRASNSGEIASLQQQVAEYRAMVRTSTKTIEDGIAAMTELRQQWEKKRALIDNLIDVLDVQQTELRQLRFENAALQPDIDLFVECYEELYLQSQRIEELETAIFNLLTFGCTDSEGHCFFCGRHLTAGRPHVENCRWKQLKGLL